MNNAKQIADKILNCETYDIPDIQELASAYLELEKEKARLKLHIDDIEKANDNCQTKIANLELEITKLKEENERLNKYVISGYETVHKESLEEITRLIEENESIRTQLLAQCRMSHELADEKEKLKEENENLKTCIDMLTPKVSEYE